MQLLKSALLLAFASFAAVDTASAAVISKTDSVGTKGSFRYHYDDSVESSCETVMMIAVGTAMSVTDYDILGNAIAEGSSMVAIIIDHKPNSPVKFGDREYANLANAIVDQITTRVPACVNAPPRNGFIIGGHSVGGQAAVGALTSKDPLLSFTPAGYFGLDPFPLGTGFLGKTPWPSKPGFNINVPGMYWGFTRQTCFVTLDIAAKAGYMANEENNRVFYQIQNPGGDITHCIFTDEGCGKTIFGTACGANDETNIRKSIGVAANRFVAAIVSGNFHKKQFQLDHDGINLYVNEELPTLVQDEPILKPAFA